MKWKALDLAWREATDLDEAQLRKLSQVIRSWEGTKYMPGVCGKQQGVDCARWGCSVLAEMEGIEMPISKIPQDAAFHDPETSTRAVRAMVQAFWPVERIEDQIIEPGYILIEGPIHGGECHMMLVGTNRSELWHSNKGSGVTKTGMVIPAEHEIKHVYKISKRNERWLR